MTAVPSATTTTNAPPRPLHDAVIVRKRLSQSTTASGLHIPENARVRDHLADVVAVGPECRDVRAGDVVIVADQCDSFRKFKWGDEILAAISEGDVLGVVE